MAACAIDLEMGALQTKVRLGMVEGFLVQLHDVGFSTFMLGMATFARALLDLFDASVESFAGADIFGDFLVAIEALAGLCFFAERFVTFAAPFLPFGMALDYFSGHHQGFQRGCGQSSGSTRGQDQWEEQ